MTDASVSSMTLIKAGFSDVDAARDALKSLEDRGMPHEALAAVPRLAQAACDPDTALRHLEGIARSLSEAGESPEAMWASAEALSRLIRVVGASDFLGRLMHTRPDILDAVVGEGYASHNWTAAQRRADLMEAVGARDFEDTATGPAPQATIPMPEAVNAMRRRYWRQMAAIAAYDLSHDDPMAVQPGVSRRLADAADAAIDAALAVAYGKVPGSQGCRFAVIGMGKLGAQELNYMSDCDLIYAVDAADGGPAGDPLTQLGTRIASTMQRACQDVIAGVTEPPLWQIDGALRPEGKAGQLVRTVESHRAYYEKWADNWEFQALLKARGVAGDTGLCEEYLEAMTPFVWNASARPNFVSDCQQMRRRVEDYIQPQLRDREIKLGKGGLRDVEFTVQMLQLVHGRTDETLRRRGTLDALQALSDGGYVSRKQAQDMSADYRFERVMEHRQQLWQFHRTHLFPDLGEGSRGGLDGPRHVTEKELDENRELRRLARAFGLRGDQLVEKYDTTRQQIRRLHLDIYYRPMLPTIAQMSDDAITLAPQAIADRFTSIGFLDPQAAMNHVNALTEGVSRASKINRILLPSVLQMLGQGQNPDMGLLQWRRLVESFSTGSPYLGFLRDSSNALQRVCHILPNSRLLGDSLIKSAESVTWLGDDAQLMPRSRESLDVRCTSARRRHANDAGDFSTSIRAMRRHEIERIGLGWMSGVVSDDAALSGMTDVYDAAISAALDWATAAQLASEGRDTAPAAITIIALGRYGGREVNFSSDADVMFLYEPTDGADEGEAFAFARHVEDTTRQLLMGPRTMEPAIDLDLDLRPEGKNGPLVRSWASTKEYYRSWADTWEHQALIRARHAAGDERLATRFLTQVADPLRYPDAPLTAAQLQQIRTLKARMEAERLPRGVRRDRHLKLGAGGLSDVEWTVQLLQLRNAGAHPALRVTGTMTALDALESEGLIGSADADALRRTWWLCTDTRNASMLWTGRSNHADVIPDDTYALGGIAACMGRPANNGQAFGDELIGLMRHCRTVAERLFYADGE